MIISDLFVNSLIIRGFVYSSKSKMHKFTIFCKYYSMSGETIIPITKILKRHEALFNMMDIDPIVLQNTKLKKATLDDDMGLTVC